MYSLHIASLISLITGGVNFLIIGTWTIDYVFAFILGIIFQYYATKPMKKLSSGRGFQGGLESRYVITQFMADRHVRLDGHFILFNF